MSSCKIVDWRNPECLEIDLEEKGWGDGRTVLLLYDGRSSNDFTWRLLRSTYRNAEKAVKELKETSH